MENKTPFDLNEAIRVWRTEFGTLNSLSAENLAELEVHLRDRVTALCAKGMPMEAAFQLAKQRLGSRQQVGAEFAKIHPQRIWLERAIWMSVGLMFFYLLAQAAGLPANLILSYGISAQWSPELAVTANKLVHYVIVGVGAALGWWCLTRKSSWVRRAGQFCVQRPWVAAFALVLALWGASPVLRNLSAHLFDWISPNVSWASVNTALIERSLMVGAIVEQALWSIALVLLAGHALRAQRQESERAQSLERALWMVAGIVLAQFYIGTLTQFVMLLWAWLLPATSQPEVQQLFGFLTAVLFVALAAATIWGGWILMTRCPRLNDWVRRTFQKGPFQAALGITLLLNFTLLLGLLLQWTGVHLTGPAVSPVVLSGYVEGHLLVRVIFPVAVLLILLRRRMKLAACA